MDMFSALAEPNRRGIVELLSIKGQLSATEISDKFKVTPQAVSQHLKVLREAELVQVEKRAQQRIYQLNPDKVDELESWIKKLRQRWEERFDALDKVLEREKRRMKR